MDVPTDAKKEEVGHDDEYNGFAESFQPAWDEAAASVATAWNHEMVAIIATRCSLCAVALPVRKALHGPRAQPRRGVL